MQHCFAPGQAIKKLDRPAQVRRWRKEIYLTDKPNQTNHMKVDVNGAKSEPLAAVYGAPLQLKRRPKIQYSNV